MGIYYVSGIPFGDELQHSGRKGMKWHKHIFGELENNTEDVRNTVQNVSSTVSGVSKSSSAGRHYADPNGDPSKVGRSGAAKRWGAGSRSQQNTKSRDPKRTISKGKSAVDKFLNRRSKLRP